MRTIAKTKHIEIIEKIHNNNKYYITVFNGNSWNKFYNKYSAFKFCYSELKR